MYGNECHNIGISGNCGWDCPVFLRGDCTVAEEAIDDELRKYDPDLYIEMRSLYGMEDDTKLLDVCGM
jgi:hypothetical protein